MPTINKLNDAQCRAAKPAAKEYKLFDGGGLYLFVSTKGGKSWRLAYRFNRKPLTLTFGPYPEVKLLEARNKKDKAKALIRDGIDPREVMRPTVEKSINLRDAAQQYWNGRLDISEGYRKDALAAIEHHLVPKLGKRPIREITRDELLECLNAMNAAGLFVYVRKVRLWISQVFEWAVAQGYAEANPADQVNPKKAFGKKRVSHFSALGERDVPEFLARLSFEDEIVSVIACKLLALLWVRTKELRFMKWPELEPGLWRVPAADMKSGEYHLVPLSHQAESLIEVMRQRSRGSEYVLPHATRLDRPMSENSILYMIYRIGFKGRMTGHGWRSVASTWANERGYMPDAIERQLAHAPQDDTRAAYNRAQYLQERKKMLQDWADWLDSCHPNSSLVQGR